MTPLKTSKTKPKSRRLQFEAIGTQWVIDVAGAPDDARQLEYDIRQRIAQFDATYSRFRTDSWLSSLGERSGTFAMPRDAEPLFAWYDRLYELTDGAVTPLIGGVLADAGYDASYSLMPQPMTVPGAWPDIVRRRDTTLTLTQPVRLDVGAAGKGYVVDIIAQLLEQRGIMQYCVDAGGDMRQRGAPLTVGLEDPAQAGQVVGVSSLHNRALCGSASNRRAWGEFHHIMHPTTLQPVRDVIATWVVAPSAMIADGISTALFFVPPQRLKPEVDFEYVILFQDGSAVISPQFPGKLFTE